MRPAKLDQRAHAHGTPNPSFRQLEDQRGWLLTVCIGIDEVKDATLPVFFICSGCRTTLEHSPKKRKKGMMT